MSDPVYRTVRRPKPWVIFLLGTMFGAFLAWLFIQPVCAATYAIDGDTFVDNVGNHIRLWGIDAPELYQTCDGQPVGLMAKARLYELIHMGDVNCQKKGADRYGRTIAICTVGKLDIGQTLVQEGLAFAYRRYSMAYVPDEGWGPVHAYHCANPEMVRRK